MSFLEYDERPWGHYNVLLDLPHCKVKHITVSPNKRLSYQKHRYRSEKWTVVKGQATVLLNGSYKYLEEGQSIDIPQGALHRLANTTLSPIEIIEIQKGSYFGEDDIIRIEDDFGRDSTPRT